MRRLGWMRAFHSSTTCPSDAKRKVLLHRHMVDPFVKQRDIDGYRSRSAYKLLEISHRFNLVRRGDVVVDLGAAPGGWTQVLVKLTNSDTSTPHREQRRAGKNHGTVISLDLAHFPLVPGAHCLSDSDIFDPATHQAVAAILGERRVDGVCSDMFPNHSSDPRLDGQRSLTLCKAALFVATQKLPLKRDVGWFVCKLIDKSDGKDLVKDVQKFFADVQMTKPEATRDESSEVYIVGRGYRPIDSTPPPQQQQ